MSITWSKATDRYLKEHSRLHHTPASADVFLVARRAFEKYLKGALGTADPVLEAITRREIIGFQTGEADRKLSSSTVNKYFRHLKAFFLWCKAEGLLGQSPTTGVKKLREVKRSADQMVIPPEKLQKLLEYLAETQDSLYADLVRVVANTGLRIGEALWLKVEDIDLGNRKLLVRNREEHMTKDKEDRKLPMNEQVYEIAERRVKEAENREGGEFLFPDPRGCGFHERAFKVDTISQGLRFRAEKAGVPGVIWYPLRHTFATRMAERYSQFQLAAAMGHSSPSTTSKFYVHREAMQLPAPPNLA